MIRHHKIRTYLGMFFICLNSFYSKELKDFIVDELYFDDGTSKANVKKYGKPLGLIRVNDIKKETFRKSVIEEWDNDNKGYVIVKRPKFLPFRE